MLRRRRYAAVLLCIAIWFGAPRAFADEAADLFLPAAGIERGLCVCLHAGEGDLLIALGKNQQLLLHGLEADADLVAKARLKIDARDLHGRVTVAVDRQVQLPYADHLVNLILGPQFFSRDPSAARWAEVVRVLSPGGVGLLQIENVQDADRLLARAKSAGISEATIVDLEGPWLRIVKSPLAGVDDWTHLNHNAGGNRVSQDTHAGPPGELRWLDGPAWGTNANGPGAALSIHGKLFYHFNPAPPAKMQQDWSEIYARDAYNGLLLWRIPVENFSALCFAASPQHLFTVLEKRGTLVALDQQSGEVALRYEAAPNPSWAVYDQGRLYVAAGPRYGRQALLCIDALNGEVHWRQPIDIQPTGALPNFVVAGELGYFLDWTNKKLGCLALASGEVRWEQDLSPFLTELKWRYGLCSHGEGTLIIGEGMRGRAIHAFSDVDGKHRWSHQYPLVLSGRSARHKGSTYDEGFFIDGLYWTHVGQPPEADRRGALAWEGLDPKSGAVKRRFLYADDVIVGDSCHRAQATVNYLMGGHSRFVETQSGDYAPRAYGIHNSCRFGMLPANGLMYTWSQYTSTYVRGLMGLTTAQDPPAESTASDRFEKGPAFGAVEEVANGEQDWPCFRHDSARSATSKNWPSAAAASLQWQTEFASAPTPPVAANDLAIVAESDAYRVTAVHVGSGEKVWTYLAGGRIACPPTLDRGYCLFGCADGWAYCLRASDGVLVWRYQAAPHERLIVVRGRLESAWPIDGGVLVEQGLACFAAGRHGTLDGGVVVAAVDPATGKEAWRQRTVDAPVVSLLASDGTEVSVGAKASFVLETGEPVGSRLLTADLYRSDSIHLSQRIGNKNNDSRLHPQLNVDAAAVVRDGDTVLVAGRQGEEPPRLEWVKQRNGFVLLDEPPAPSDADGAYFLWAFSLDDGRLQWSQPLPAAPIFDGLSVAAGTVYLATADHQLLAFRAAK